MTPKHPPLFPKPYLLTPSPGYTLIEVLVTIVLLSLVAIPFITAINNLNRHFIGLASVAKAHYLTQRNLEVAANLIYYDWTIINHPEDDSQDIQHNQPYHVERTSNGWQFLLEPATIGPYTTRLSFHPVCRDAQLETIDCNDPNSANLDPNSIKAISLTTWKQNQRDQKIETQAIYTYVF